MVRKAKRKPLIIVDGNRLPRGKVLRHDRDVDDDAFDFLSTTSSSVTSRPSKRPRPAAATGAAGALAIDSDTKTPRISNLSLADRTHSLSSLLPPRPDKHNTTLTVMSASTMLRNSGTTAHSQPTATLKRKLPSLAQAQQALPQLPRARHAKHVPSQRSKQGLDPVIETPESPLPSPLQVRPTESRAALQKLPAAKPSLHDSLSQRKDSPQQEALESPLPESPNVQKSPFGYNNDHSGDNDNDDIDNDDMDTDSDGSPNSISLEATKHQLPVDKAPVDKPSVLTATTHLPMTASSKLVASKSSRRSPTDDTVPVAAPKPISARSPKTPRWLHRSSQPKIAAAPSIKTINVTPAAPTVASANELRSAAAPMETKKKTSPLLQSALRLAQQLVAGKQLQKELSPPSMREMNSTRAAPVRKTPKSDVQKRIDKVLSESDDVTVDNGQAGETPALAVEQVVVPKSATKKRTIQAHVTNRAMNKTHTPSALEQLEERTTQLVRPVSRNALDRYRRSPADNHVALQAMMQSGKPPDMQTPESFQADKRLIGTEVKVQPCDSFDGSEMTMEDLQPFNRPKKKTGQVRNMEATMDALDDLNPITDATIPQMLMAAASVQEIIYPTSSAVASFSPKVPELPKEKFLEQAKAKPLDSLGVKSVASNPRGNASPELWTLEAAGYTNQDPIFELSGGVKYRHPPMPPGWSLGVSQSKNMPYYYHRDFGTSFCAPVVLPSTNGPLPAPAQQVSRRVEQSIQTFSFSGFGTERSNASKATVTGPTVTTHGKNPDKTEPEPDPLSGSKTFDSPLGTIQASSRKLFSFAMGSNEPASETTHAEGSFASSPTMPGTQASPAAIDAFSDDANSQPSVMANASKVPSIGSEGKGGSHSSTILQVEETVYTVKHARRSEGAVTLATAYTTDDSVDSASPSMEPPLAATEAACKRLRAETRIGVGFEPGPSAKLLESTPVSSVGSKDARRDDTLDAAPSTPMYTAMDDNYVPETDAASPVDDTAPDDDSFPIDDNGSPMDEDAPREYSVGAALSTPMEGSMDDNASPVDDTALDVDSFPNDDNGSPPDDIQEDRSLPSDDERSPVSSCGNGGPPSSFDGIASLTPNRSVNNETHSEFPEALEGPSPVSDGSNISGGGGGEESPPFPDNDGPSSSPEEIRFDFGNNLIPHLNAEARKRSPNLSRASSHTDGDDDEGSAVSSLGQDGASYQRTMRHRMGDRGGRGKPSRVTSRSKSSPDDISLMETDGDSYAGAAGSIATRSKGSRCSSFVSHMSHRVLHPPMPICVLQHLEKLPKRKKKPKSKKKKVKQAKKKKKPLKPPRPVVASLFGMFS